jgi:hypothetical protein
MGSKTKAVKDIAIKDRYLSALHISHWLVKNRVRPW